MSDLMNFDGNNVEVFEFEGKVLFNPYDVGRCLDLAESSVRNHLSKMSSNQSIKLTNSNVLNKDFRKLHNTGEKFLTESGVYKLIFKSEKPDAERFQDWVTDEVLPTLRKEGSYSTKTLSPMDQLRLQYEVLEGHDEALKEHSSRIEHLENNMVIDHGQARSLSKALSTVVGSILEEAFGNNSLTKRTYQAAWKDFKDYFNINSYNNTLKKDFQEAMELVKSWRPSGSLLREINEEKMQVRI